MLLKALSLQWQQNWNTEQKIELGKLLLFNDERKCTLHILRRTCFSQKSASSIQEPRRFYNQGLILSAVFPKVPPPHTLLFKACETDPVNLQKRLSGDWSWAAQLSSHPLLSANQGWVRGVSWGHHYLNLPKFFWGEESSCESVRTYGFRDLRQGEQETEEKRDSGGIQIN